MIFLRVDSSFVEFGQQLLLELHSFLLCSCFVWNQQPAFLMNREMVK